MPAALPMFVCMLQTKIQKKKHIKIQNYWNIKLQSTRSTAKRLCHGNICLVYSSSSYLDDDDNDDNDNDDDDGVLQRWLLPWECLFLLSFSLGFALQAN